LQINSTGMKKIYLTGAIFLILFPPACAQDAAQLKSLSTGMTIEGITELVSFLSLPNDALVREDIKKNVEWLTAAFRKRRFTTEILETYNTPLFLAERKFEGAERTVLFYMHFDGQGVDPSKWYQDDPYKPVLKEIQNDEWITIPWDNMNRGFDPEWRIFGRSSSDDKGPIIMFLNAVDIIDSEFGGKSQINLKVILDGEEEKGSQQLPPAVEKYRDKLLAHFMIINDGPIHVTGRPTIVFGGRGLVGINLTVYGPRTAQHSGHYGNYAPNPAFMMSHILASMKDREGRVVIPGFYDGINIDDETLAILRGVPDDPVTINEVIGISEPEKVGRFYQESLQYPSLNVRGLQSAWIGSQVRTIVPDIAVAAIDIRLVPEVDPDRLVRLVREHIGAQGCYVIDREPTEEERLTRSWIVRFESAGSARLPFRTEINSEIGNWLTTAISTGTGEEPVVVRIMGGTVPIAPFISALDIPAVLVPLVNPDNNQHGPNENLRIWNFTNGVQTFLSIMLF